MFSLESLHRGNSNKYTQYTIFNTKKENHPNFFLNLQLWDSWKGLKNEFETGMGNKPSVLAPLKFYCTIV